MDKLGLYIHIPFCIGKCYYCDFYSITDKKYIALYINALCKDIEKYQNKAFTSIYIGGGSPSLLDTETITKLFNGLNKLNLLNIEEVTIEANPSQITAEKLACYLKLGINRISVGVQSFNTKILKNIGRIHTGEAAINAVKLAKSAGFENISVDLIYGLPGESILDVTDDIKQAADLNIEHISAYSLMLEENTLLYDLVADKKINLPTDETVEEMYDIVNQELPALGYNRYEVSNYAKNNYECKHNLLYWSDFPYIGLGAAAASFVDNIRYKNNCSVEEYIYKINRNFEVNIMEDRTKNDAIFEYIFLSLRKVIGLKKQDFQNKFNINFEKEFKSEIQELKKLNLLRENEDYIYLTPKGFKVSNMVFEKFIK